MTDIWKDIPRVYCDDSGKRYGTGQQMIDRLKWHQPVIESLPRTKDGHPLHPGRVVWLGDGGAIEEVRIICVSSVAATYVPLTGPDRKRGDLSAPAYHFFATREAAIDDYNSEHTPNVL